MAQRYAVTSDVHSCFAELVALLEGLGFTVRRGAIVPPPDGRRLLFAGDLIDRGPDAAATILLFARLVREGHAELAALGNHDERLLYALEGRPFRNPPSSALTETLRQIVTANDPARVRD